MFIQVVKHNLNLQWSHLQCLVFNAVSTIVQSYQGGLFTNSYVSWRSHTSTSYNISSKQLAAFPHRLIAHWWKTNDACHNDFLSNVRKKVGRAGVRFQNPWIDSPHRYRLSYRSTAKVLYALRLEKGSSL